MVGPMWDVSSGRRINAYNYLKTQHMLFYRINTFSLSKIENSGRNLRSPINWLDQDENPNSNFPRKSETSVTMVQTDRPQKSNQWSKWGISSHPSRFQRTLLKENKQSRQFFHRWYGHTRPFLCSPLTIMVRIPRVRSQRFDGVAVLFLPLSPFPYEKKKTTRGM